jgi:E3 ubiquitin-protein ligase MYCBP2
MPKCGTPDCGKLPDHPRFADEVRRWSEIQDRINGEMARIPEDNKREPAKMLFYMCSKCRTPFFGGLAECGGEDLDVDVTCMKCSRNYRKISCEIHGENGMTFKCFYCCSPALFRCSGCHPDGALTWYCELCHRRPFDVQKGPFPACLGEGKCPYAPHQPNGVREVHGFCDQCETAKEVH